MGPEDPLANGIYDVLAEDNIKCFGPSKLGSQIEANKDWSKAFMIRNNIPTAQYESFTDPEAAKKFILRYFVHFNKFKIKLTHIIVF